LSTNTNKKQSEKLDKSGDVYVDYKKPQPPNPNLSHKEKLLQQSLPKSPCKPIQFKQYMLGTEASKQKVERRKFFRDMQVFESLKQQSSQE